MESGGRIPARFTRSQDHHETYLPLIQWELDDELDATDERLRNWSRAKLAAHGLALFDLRARPDGWLFGQRIVKLELDGRADMGQHRFRQGDIVMLSRGDPIGEKPIEAIFPDWRSSPLIAIPTRNRRPGLVWVESPANREV